jgi:tRNA pseudouridine65 synthase
MNIIYQDNRIVVINKPSGMICHRNEWTRSHEVPAMQLTRNTVKQQVYTIHRIDRSTSGILVFAKDKKTASLLQSLFAENKIKKTYHALVRGWVNQDSVVTKKLDDKECESSVEVISHLLLNYPVGRYDQARYSLVRLKPKTGRNHQLRRHLVHLRHPIVGDRVRGDRDHNQFFKEALGFDRLWLFATSIVIPDFLSVNGVKRDLNITCPIASKCKKFLLKQAFTIPEMAANKNSDLLRH